MSMAMKPRSRFVSSKDVPTEMAAEVALIAHRRGCGSFNGDRAVSPQPFVGSHRGNDIVWAQVHIADLCNALRITPVDIVAMSVSHSRAALEAAAREPTS